VQQRHGRRRRTGGVGNQTSETRSPTIDPDLTLPTLTVARGLKIEGHHLPFFPSPSREMPIISSIISGNICYHSLQNILSSSLLPKNIFIKVLFFPVVLRPNAGHGLLILEVF
jgi:hypothetical protein